MGLRSDPEKPEKQSFEVPPIGTATRRGDSRRRKMVILTSSRLAWLGEQFGIK
jgi:hypothetical protein